MVAVAGRTLERVAGAFEALTDRLRERGEIVVWAAVVIATGLAVGLLVSRL